jgi:hypothetical protein
MRRQPAIEDVVKALDPGRNRRAHRSPLSHGCFPHVRSPAKPKQYEKQERGKAT